MPRLAIDPRQLRAVMEQRLLARKREDPLTGCWIWEGCWNGKGHGLIRIPGTRATSKNVTVHRVAAWLWLGLPSFDSPWFVGHDLKKCPGTPACFQPAHLKVFRGGRKEFGSYAGKHRAKRMGAGEAHSAAKMTAFEAQCVIDACLEGTEEDDVIAARLNAAGGHHNITPGMVAYIRARRTWKHLWQIHFLGARLDAAKVSHRQGRSA